MEFNEERFRELILHITDHPPGNLMDSITRLNKQHPLHAGPETRIKREREGHERMSILGAGLVAIQEECGEWVNWDTPETKEGMTWWAADDTMVTLADHYGMRTQTIDELDEMALKGATLHEMAQFIQEQPIIL